MSNLLLHEENLLRIPLTGEYLRDGLAQRVGEVALATEGLQDPAVSVVIRSRNNASQLEGLLDDISSQDFDSEVEVVVVDTESTDGTVQVAKQFGATLVPTTQEGFNYPKALNLGFVAASHEWVFSFVDHSALTNTQILRTATRSQSEGDVAGVSGITFPNANATWVELTATAIDFPKRVRKPASTANKTGLGFLATNTSLINKNAWSEVGGFDESYGAGGEDGALAKAILDAGHKIIIDPAMSVYHSHGLGLVGGIRQLRYWQTIGKPHEFNRQQLAKYRRELR